MNKQQYHKYLRSKEWQKIRLDLLMVKGFKCERCENVYKPKFLHVHHLTYKRIGREEPEDLEVLCAGCHNSEHDINPKKRKHKKKKVNPKSNKKGLSKEQKELLRWKESLKKKRKNNANTWYPDRKNISKL